MITFMRYSPSQLRIRAEIAFDELRWSWQHRTSYWRRAREHRRLWREAGSYAELCGLMARFCDGELLEWPGHGGPRDPETVEIAESLVHANLRGFLTVCSQPGVYEESADADCPAAFLGQRAAVNGFAGDDVLARLRAAVEGTRLVLRASRVRPGWSIGYSTAVPVTVVNGEIHTEFGAHLPSPEIEFIFDGVRGPLVGEIVASWQVLIYDPHWGEHALLWETLSAL